MRTMLSALVVVGLALLPQVGIAGEKPETAKANVYKVGVKGMTWGASCAKVVRETLSKIKNVAKVTVDFKAKVATVTMAEKSTLEEKTIAAALPKRYTVSSFALVGAGKKYVLSVSGMVWGVSCAKKVRATLAKLPGVAKVKIDFKAKTAAVDMKAGAELAEADATKALKDAGFGLTAMKAADAPKKKSKKTKKVS